MFTVITLLGSDSTASSPTALKASTMYEHDWPETKPVMFTRVVPGSTSPNSDQLLGPSHVTAIAKPSSSLELSIHWSSASSACPSTVAVRFVGATGALSGGGGAYPFSADQPSPSIRSPLTVPS